MYTGCNKKIESAKYLEKYTLDRNVKKKVRVQCFYKKLFVDTKNDDLPSPLAS